MNAEIERVEMTRVRIQILAGPYRIKGNVAITRSAQRAAHRWRQSTTWFSTGSSSGLLLIGLRKPGSPSGPT